MDDLINRMAAIDAFMNATADGDKVDFCISVVKSVPSVQRLDEDGAFWINIDNFDDDFDKITRVVFDDGFWCETFYQDAQQEQRWIPCGKRLPEANGRYLVTRGLNACGSMWNRVHILNYSDLMGLKSERIWWDGNVGKSDFERIDDVLAWMPLPEPWKGESDG